MAGRLNNKRWLENPLFLHLQRFKLYLWTFFWVGVFGKFEEFLEISSFCKFPINVLLELVPVFRHKVLLKAWYINNQSWYIQTITPDIQTITHQKQAHRRDFRIGWVASDTLAQLNGSGSESSFIIQLSRDLWKSLNFWQNTPAL